MARSSPIECKGSMGGHEIRCRDTAFRVTARASVGFGSLAVHQSAFACTGVMSAPIREFRHAPVFSQRLKNNRRGPSKQQYSVHSRHRAKQTPTFHWHNVAIAECRVIHECKINEIGTGRHGMDYQIRQSPNDYFNRMCSHQHRHGRNHNSHQKYSRMRFILCANSSFMKR